MQRYQRHISLNEIGLLGQIKLSKAKVLVVGAGGLGIPSTIKFNWCWNWKDWDCRF
jgi:adenylyltransferase/sulfurtransferase